MKGADLHHAKPTIHDTKIKSTPTTQKYLKAFQKLYFIQGYNNSLK